MMCQVYGYTPEQVSNLTLSQFSEFYQYALRSRIEDLLGWRGVVNDKGKVTWKEPGAVKVPQMDPFEAKLKALKSRTGKNSFTADELSKIL
jgi:hypothetical protein